MVETLRHRAAQGVMGHVILSDSEESLIVLETLRYAQGDMVVITTT